MSKEYLIELEGITKRYTEHKQIGEISFPIKKGEITALCGGNGAGKSTLIKLLTGIIKPTSGTMKADGKPVDPMSERYKAFFSYMPDDMIFPNQLTGLEMLLFFAGLQGIAKSRVDEVLKRVGLFEDRRKLIKHYSKGMQQRLSLAQALLSAAPLLILDEPTNGLDPFWVFRFKEIIKEEKEAGKTILFSTHILSIVEEIADTAIFLEEGKLIYHENIDVLTNTAGKYNSLEKVFFEKQIVGVK
ncbi:ABC transporter ATP-binding protein [Bacillus sp. FJAT-49705]|uniref:ABC transporter ATP-binding protein n=1 Tax=Cytobacillus citreus TaxID=2833586 RepID=A0ABS5NWH4_9BACI|nr:ABC transporter ATP-binding protein [Cytobacillus citreus]MBS4192176.1 ABC transporter ATP-binding protein [Cytobacillus citreus]